MSLVLFENELRKECKNSYKDLKNGDRIKRLQKRKINSMRDVMSKGKTVSYCKLDQSCIITFGNVLEKTTLNYAKVMGEKVYKNKNFLSAKIDIVFRINRNIYNLESKCNIELDAGKSKKALETLKRKHKMVFMGLDCQNDGLIVISKFIVWTKETAKDASKTAKRPIEEKHLMGFKDFFNLFDVEVNSDEFFDMLQRVYGDEVVRYFPK